MILTDLQRYLSQKEKVSLAELEIHFKTSGDALRGMLDLLVRKGRARKLASQKCKSCHACADELLEFYESTTRC
ncbi:MAG: FeoC-like transcriptional regulator [Cyanobacteriota bacterium]|nr:FeoC-like transcriptional regulator [Cyanobacteriota bacterium]